MQDNPVFIAGPDRSGTTLMYALLASHPNISMVRRTNMWRYFYQRYGPLDKQQNFERCLQDMLSYKRMNVLNPNAERIRDAFWQGEPTYGRLFGLMHSHHAQDIGKPRWGDKSLHTEHYADSLFKEFPNAKVIHMARDPRDRYASVKKRHGRTINRVGASVGRWLYSMQAARRNNQHYPQNYMIVNYERLASQPEEMLTNIFGFLGEEYTPKALSMSGAADYRDSGGNSSFEKIEPGTISTKSIGRYRSIISPVELAYIQIFAGKEMQKLGYELDPLDTPFQEKIALLGAMPINLARMLAWITLTDLKIKRGEPIPPNRMAMAT